MNRLRTYRPIITRAGIGLLLTLFIYTILWLLRWFFFTARFSLNSDLVFLVTWVASYFLVAALIWIRRKLLWSLRNQMAAAYILIAVVPVMLVLTIVGLGAYLLYWQLGSYVLYTEMQTRVTRVYTVAGGLATTLAVEAANGKFTPTLPIPKETLGFLDAAKADIPGLQVEIGKGEDLLAQTGSTEAAGFKGIVLSGRSLAFRAVQVRTVANAAIKVIVSVSAPITPGVTGYAGARTRPHTPFRLAAVKR